MKATKSIGIYILRGITLLIAVAIIAFLLAQISPVDPVRQYIQANPGVSAENVEAMKEYWGLNDPPVERFFKWFSAVLHGDWGYSTTFRQPVLQVIGVRFKTSLALMIAAWTFSGILGFAIGCVMALFRDRMADRIIKRICLIMCSVPTFWIGLVFLAVFSAMLGWFPFGLAVPAGVPAEAVTLGQRIHHLILPALTLIIVGIGGLMRYTRTNTLEVLNADYIRTARAKGLPESRVIGYHAFRNTLIPIVTILGGTLPSLFSGALITEQLFSVTGIGYTAYQSMTVGDIPFTMFYLSFIAILTLLGNLLADILYAVVDPRVRVN